MRGLGPDWYGLWPDPASDARALHTGFMTTGQGGYIHGTDPDEQYRLSKLNTIINAESFPMLELKPGMRVLDVGAGLCQFSRLVARAVAPGGRTIAIERSPEQIAEAERLAMHDGDAALINDGTLEIRQGDAMDLPVLPGEKGKFDLAHARFLLEHVRDPQRVVRAMVEAVRPGGRIVLEDDDHEVLRLWPEPPGFRELWHAYTRTYDRLGNDPIVGRRLVELLHRAGATPSRARWLWFGGCAGDGRLGPLVQNAVGILRGAQRMIVDQGLLPASSVDRSIDELDAWARRPDAALWFAISWAEGIRPA